MQKYHVMGQPTSYGSDLLTEYDPSEEEWKDKARRLQARRWRKIMRAN